MKAVRSDDHRSHDPAYEVEFGSQVPVHERPQRVDAIAEVLGREPGIDLVAPTAHGLAPIEAVHDPDLVDFLAHAWRDWVEATGHEVAIAETFTTTSVREGMGPNRVPSGPVGRFSHYVFDTSTPMVEGTYAAARAAVDIALTATDVVLAGEPVAYGLCRPPGHHAPRAAFGGFCYFNNAGVAAQHARGAGATKVTVLDVDYHHGNGTQQLFYDRPDVQYVSLHGDPDHAYPYFAGYADETGTGAGAGTTTNLPLAAGTTDEQYLERLAKALDAVARFGPDLLIVSLGVDTYELDPLGDLALTTEVFAPMGQLVGSLELPTVVLQEGGYHLPSLGANVAGFLRGVT
jgi:acetoin utilization deacetylase AcuC-like enzyme